MIMNQYQTWGILTGLLGYTLEIWLFSRSTVQLRKQLMVWSSYFWLGALMTKVTGLSTAPESMAHITSSVGSKEPELPIAAHYHDSGLTWGGNFLKSFPFWNHQNTCYSPCCVWGGWVPPLHICLTPPVGVFQLPMVILLWWRFW